MGKIKVKIQLVSEGKYMPKKAHDTDACYDVYASSINYEDEYKIIYGLGIKLDLPSNVRMDIRSRSSIHKTGLVLSNGIGTGDPDYKGEYSAVFYKINQSCKPYEIGERIAQIHFEFVNQVEFTETKELETSVRGNGGYGSTGRF